jgi:chemotaxis protein methyltransferase CheR
MSPATASPALAPTLADACGLDLAAYRPEHVDERVRRALVRERLPGARALARLLVADPGARARFRRAIAVSVTGLFRDREQFELLDRELLPPLLADGRELTVWSAGCADGSELYSVALLLERHGALGRARLLGSDLLPENLAAAERAVYRGQTMPPRLRERARFERRDLVAEPAPAGPFGLVLCRNLAIYLTATATDALYGRLAAALARGGVLLLGRSERIARPGELGLERAGSHAYRRRS